MIPNGRARSGQSPWPVFGLDEKQCRTRKPRPFGFSRFVRMTPVQSAGPHMATGLLSFVPTYTVQDHLADKREMMVKSDLV